MNNTNIIFLHQVKTAGESIRALIRQNLPKNEFLIKNEDKLFTIESHIINQIRHYIGHCKYGVHKNLVFDNYKYVMILRDPIERAISYYLYVKQRPVDPHYKAAQKYSLYDFIDYNNQMRNGQFRKIVQYDNFNITQCIDIIEKDFMFVGIFEHIEETLYYIAKLFNIKDYQIPHKNKNKNKNKIIESVDNKTLKKLISHNQYDIKLYNLMLTKYPYYKEKIDLIYD